VQRFTPLLADAARFTRHSPGDRWFVDETYVKSTESGDRTAQLVIGAHAFLRRGHHELGVDARSVLRFAAAFTELAQAI
jgi:hypothetical protein